MEEFDARSEGVTGAFIDGTEHPVRHEGIGGVSLWSGIDRREGISVSTSRDAGTMLVGVCSGKNGYVVAMSTEDALWLGRQLVDLANR